MVGYSLFIGIDALSRGKPFTFVALDNERKLSAHGRGYAADVLAFTAGQSSAVVTAGCPAAPNRGLLPPTLLAQPAAARLAEHDLRIAGFTPPNTPGEPAQAPPWMRAGFRLTENLNRLGYLPSPEAGAPRARLETHPDSAFQSLLKGIAPFPANSLEGRLQRQLVLYERGLPVPDPMDFFEEITRHKLMRGILPTERLFTLAELNAWVAAYTAWLFAHEPGALRAFGDPAEGLVHLPA